MPEKILVIDDDTALLRIIELALSTASYEPIMATGGEAGLSQLIEHRPDLVILDVMMPDMDGWETCQRIRQVSTVPIIFLTAKHAVSDRISGLTIGADDYIVKPFLMSELLARVEAVLRRSTRRRSERDSTIVIGKQLVIDRRTRQVIVRGQPMALRPAEYAVLLALAEHNGRIVSADQIGRALGIEEPNLRARRVKWHIWKLRQSIERAPSQPEMIVTEPNAGYRLVPLD